MVEERLHTDRSDERSSLKITTPMSQSEAVSCFSTREEVWPKIAFARVAVCERQGLRPSMEDAAAVHSELLCGSRRRRDQYAETRFSSFTLRGTLKLDLDEPDDSDTKNKKKLLAEQESQRRVQAFFGVFDGHGGNTSADFVSEALPLCLAKEPNLRADPEEALKLCFKRCDEQLYEHFDSDLHRDTAGTRSGCTAVTVYLDYNHTDKSIYLYCANLGDSRCILVKRNGTHVPLSRDHVPGDPEEKKRIEDAGGQIKPARPASKVLRVLGALSVTRSFGDFVFKMPTVQDFSTEKQIEEDLVLSTPEVMRHKVDLKEDLAVVLACDGVWNTFTNEEAAIQVSDKLLHRLPTANKRTPATDTKFCAEAAEFLVDNAIARGSTDNCTAMVALLDPVIEEHPDVLKALAKAKNSIACVIL